MPGTTLSTTRRISGATFVSLLALLVTSFTTVPASAVVLGPPTLLTPTPGATVGANPELHWETLTGATKYRVQVSTSSSYSSFSYNKDTYNTYATPDADLPLGTLYWRVAGIDGSTVGAFAEDNFIKEWAEFPTLTSPADGAALTYPTDPLLFTWDPLPGADSYSIEIDDDSEFIGVVAVTTENTSYTLIEAQTFGQAFYWRVRGKSATTNVFSGYSETRTYTVDWPGTPTLIDPVSTTVEDVEFVWSSVTGAATYRLEVSTNEEFSTHAIDVTVKGTRYSPPSGLDNDTYFWQVTPKDGASPANAGTTAPIGPPATFTRAWSDVPTLLLPADGDFFVSDSTLSWTAVTHASHYEFWLGSDPNFSNGTYDSCNTNRTIWNSYVRTSGSTPATPGGCSAAAPNPGDLYYWKVRAIDAPSNILGEWSDVFDFIYKPTLPTLTSPADGASVSAPVLTWNPVDDIEKYKVTIGTSTVTTYATSFSPVSSLALGTYTWYVQTVDHEGNDGIIGASRTFTLIDPTTTFASPTPTGPTDGSSSVRMPSLTWNPVTDADHYTVWYGVTGSGLVSELRTNVPFAAYTHNTAILAPGSYTWFVEAFNATDDSLGVGSTRTFVISNLDVAVNVSPANCSTCVLNDTPTLTWETVDGAGYYEVHISADDAFTNELKIFETEFTSMSIRESLLDSQAGQAYYWFVRPCKKSGSCGPFDSTVFGNAFAFQKASVGVEGLLPVDADGLPLVDETFADQVTFTWTDYLATNGAQTPPIDQEARQYFIQVSTAFDFATTLDSATVDQTTYTPYNKTYPEGPIYWRVRAIDGSSNSLTWSSVGSLTKASAALTPTAPDADETVTGVPFFQWDPQAFAAKYKINVAKNNDTTFTSTNLVVNTTTQLTAYSPTGALPAGTYAWRVARLDADNRQGPWSTTRSFTLAQTAPSLLSPADGYTSTDNNLLFTWSAVQGASAYRFQVSTSSSFATLYRNQKTVMTEWAPFELYAGNTYYWRVAVLDSDDNILATSSSRSFLHDITHPTVTAKAPTSSASHTGNFTVTFSEAVTGVSTSTFKMKIAGTTTAVAGTVTTGGGGTTATFNPSSTLIPGESYTLSLTNGITDIAGNTLVPFSWTVRTALLVEQSSSAVRSVWDDDDSGSASGGSYHSSKTTGARATFSFTGTNVTLRGRRSTNGGYADIYIDGVKKVKRSFYNASAQYFDAYSITGLTNAPHKLEVRVLGTKPAASSDEWVFIDAYKVGAITYQENSSKAIERFRRVSSSSSSGGSYDSVAHSTAGDNGSKPYMKMTWKGTRIKFYAKNSTAYGKATIYIDSVYRGTIDQYRASTAYNVVEFTSAVVANAQHTITIFVSGTKNASSSGTTVTFDRFQIT